MLFSTMIDNESALNPFRVVVGRRARHPRHAYEEENDRVVVAYKFIRYLPSFCRIDRGYNRTSSREGLAKNEEEIDGRKQSSHY